MTVNDVVQFTESHKWCGCFGVIVKNEYKSGKRRYMIGVPIPQQGVAYIFDDGSNIECIGKAVLVEKDEAEEEA